MPEGGREGGEIEKNPHVKSILTSGLVFQVVLGVFLTLLSFPFSGFLATNIFQCPKPNAE